MHEHIFNFEHWTIRVDFGLPYISVDDNEKQTTFFAQGEEAEELVQSFDQLGISEFLDWFYESELDLAMDPIGRPLIR